VAAWGLPSAHRLPEQPLDDGAFDRLVAESAGQRVLGLLGAAIADGTLPVSVAQRGRFDETWQAWLGHALQVERLTARVVTDLAVAAVPARVLKGVALAHTAYAEPAHRVFGDVDLLVPHDRLHHAVAVLEQTRDARRAEPEVAPGFDDRFGREAMVRVDGIEVDLHRTLVNGAFGVRVDLGGLFAEPEPIVVDGTEVATLPAPARLVHAAYGATLSDWPPRLVAFRDLVQILVREAPPTDAVIDTARRWRGEAVLAAGVVAAWRALRMTTRPRLLDWAEAHRPATLDRLFIASARGPARGYTAGLTTLAVTPGFGARVAYLRAVLRPSAQYREARGLGRAALVGAGARRARRG
jgi:hypothetical protein